MHSMMMREDDSMMMREDERTNERTNEQMKTKQNKTKQKKDQENRRLHEREQMTAHDMPPTHPMGRPGLLNRWANGHSHSGGKIKNAWPQNAMRQTMASKGGAATRTM